MVYVVKSSYSKLFGWVREYVYKYKNTKVRVSLNIVTVNRVSPIEERFSPILSCFFINLFGIQFLGY